MEAIRVHVPETELKLGPLGDIQYGAQGCDTKKLRRHVEFACEHDWRLLGMGDYIDFMSPGNRARLMQASLYDDTKKSIDLAATEIADSLMKDALSSSKGRWLGLLEGHHFHEHSDGSTTDHHLCDLLSAPFLGSSAFVHVYLSDFPLPVRIWCHHGHGGAIQTTTGKFPHMERVSADNEADIYLEGHIHRKYGVPIDRLAAVPLKDGSLHIVSKTFIAGFTGSFLRGWMQGSTSPAGYPRGSYAEQRVLRTIPTGGLLITAKPVKERWGWRLDMFVSA